ncbi:hypothetical protein VNO80_06905 [Phaseolus coccineus]|uniref:Uncharacterized protein n=1 Tax=Phaseolus coccineus TaxID=3886 RepID=A0AAN9NJ53_PHACN
MCRDLLLKVAAEGFSVVPKRFRGKSFLQGSFPEVQGSVKNNGDGEGCAVPEWNLSFRSVESSGSVSRRRGPVSTHELHYTVNRAASMEMKKKTLLP